MEEIKLTKCFSCGKCYKEKLMEKIIIQQPCEESYIETKRFLCPECKDNLDRNNWVKERNLKEVMEKKQEDKDKENDR